jgi:Fe-S cluster biogenesis protein NfuA/nitrite reductase/ring-hydroxylating ferredoxin subunit
MSSLDVRQAGARVEQLLGELDAHADERVRDRAEELVRALVGLYGAALERIVELAGADTVDRFADDELLASLLVLHDLHPLDVTERVRRALDKVRPYLGSHAGGVRLLGVDGDGVVSLALEGSCDGCPSSAVTVQLAIEGAILQAAPEVVRVDVTGVVAEPQPPHLIPVESLFQRPAADPAGEWTVVSGLADLQSGELRAVEVGGTGILVCRCETELYAYQKRCPACGADLAGGALADPVLTCPGCARGYDVRRAGRGVDDPPGEGPSSGGVHLAPLPLLVRDGQVRIAVRLAQPVAVPS